VSVGGGVSMLVRAVEPTERTVSGAAFNLLRA